MTKAINKKVLSAVLFLAMVLNIFSGLALPASAEDTVAGKWSGSTTAANGTVYSFDLTLEANGDYTLVNTYKLGEDTYKETENGTYAAAGGKIDFTGDKLIVEAMEATYSADKTSGTVSGDTMTVTRHASFMAKSMGKAAVEITFKQTEKAVTYEDNLKAGKYELTEESYDASAFMKLPMLITIDTEKKTFNTQDAREGKELANKGFGNYTFDEKTGIYTVTYTADTAEGATTSFTYSDKGLTFVTPICFGKASMNITDENDNFIPYTAKLVADDDSSGSEENTDDANTPADDNSGSEENTDDANTPADDDNDDTQAPADDENAPADDNKNAQSGGSATSNPKTGTMAGGVMLTLSLAGIMALAVSKKKK